MEKWYIYHKKWFAFHFLILWSIPCLILLQDPYREIGNTEFMGNCSYMVS